MLWKLAWRNLWKNRTRTIIVGTAIVFSYALLLIEVGIMDDLFSKMQEDAATGAGGQVLVHGDQWWDNRTSDILIDQPREVRAKLEAIEGVETIIPRVIISGLASSSRGNEPINLRGIELAGETALEDPTEDLERGRFFSDKFDHPIVLSEKLVDKLGVELGDKVVLTATDPGGEVTRALFRLDGVVAATSVSERLAYTTIAAAQEAVGMGKALTQFGVLTSPSVPHELVAERARAALGGGQLEVLTWQEAVPEMVGYMQMEYKLGYGMLFVVFIVVLFAIANTFLMAVMERIREFGLLNAIGMTPGRIGRLVLWETAILAALSMAIGLAIALGVHAYLANFGINLAEVYGTDMEIANISTADMVMGSTVVVWKWAAASLSVFVAIIASAIYPAWRAATLTPAEAMRFYE
jgi:ABC-type lipoprotein release transport system permease subunit